MTRKKESQKRCKKSFPWLNFYHFPHTFIILIQIYLPDTMDAEKTLLN